MMQQILIKKRKYNIMFKKDTNRLLDELKAAQEQNDYDQMAKCYLKLGKAYKQDGKLSKAVYYLSRFDNLVSGDDDLYETFDKQDSQTTQWIEELESQQEPYEKTIQSQVVEKSQELSDLQKIQWMLLTMSRFCSLFERISALEDFEGFETLSEMVDLICGGLYGELDTDNADDIQDAMVDYDDLLEDVFDSEVMCDYTQTVQIPNQPDFIPADLESGDVGTHYFGMAFAAMQSFIFDTERRLSECPISGTAKLEEPADLEFVACGILADYFYRTSDAELKDVPQIQQETTRIFSDYDFIKSAPDYEAFQERINEYKTILLV